MIKKKNDIDYEYFEGCDDKLKSDLFDVVSNHGEMFQEPNGLPPKRGIQHEIQLQQMFHFQTLACIACRLWRAWKSRSKFKNC